MRCRPRRLLDAAIVIVCSLGPVGCTAPRPQPRDGTPAVTRPSLRGARPTGAAPVALHDRAWMRDRAQVRDELIEEIQVNAAAIDAATSRGGAPDGAREARLRAYLKMMTALYE